MTREGGISPSVSQPPLRDPDTICRMTDAKLLERFLTQGEETAELAFTALVERHGAAVRRVCLDVLGDRHEAQDAAQAAFLILARKARSIRKPRSLGPWLHGVALRVARRARVEAMRRREAERGGAEEMVQRAKQGWGGESPLYPELHEEIDRLPEKYRTPIVLCYLQGHTQEQAARVLGWPYGTVQTRLHRGRQRLRDRLARRGVGLISLVGSSVTPPLFESSAAFVPPGWAQETGRAAVRFAAHRGLGGSVAPLVPRLAGLVLKTMLHESLRALAVGLLALGLASAGVALALQGATAGRQGRPAADRFGPKNYGDLGRPEGLAHGEAGPLAREAQSNGTEPQMGSLAVEGASPTIVGMLVRGVDRRDDDAPGKKLSDRVPVPTLPRSRYLDVEAGRLARNAPAEQMPGRLGGLRRPDGRELFERVWNPGDPRSHGGDGLGPVFNARSCVECHDLGGPGGAGSLGRNIDIATADGANSGGFGFSYSFAMGFGAGGFEYRMTSNPSASSRRASLDPGVLATIHPGFREARSLVLHRFGTDRTYQAWREAVPGAHGAVMVRTSQRNPTPLFGIGLIDRIPDEAIVAAAARRFPGSAQVRGRISRLKGGRIGRFGWKAQTATLDEFIRSAAATEMGLEVAGHPQAADPRLPGVGAPGPDMDQEECEALILYVRSLPPPVVREPADGKDESMTKAGETTFKSIGCAGCHMPRLGDVEGVYSDLLLHDMSPQLGDTGQYGLFVTNPAGANGPALPGEPREERAGATLQEWRTPPLWGLRDSAPYLHDGRAATIDQAIALHGGQGTSSAKRYAQLSPRRKQQLEAFLMSMAAPPRDVDRDGQAGDN